MTKPKNKKNPRERVKELSQVMTIKVPAYDARPIPLNDNHGAATYVEKVHAILNNEGTEIGWYGWSEKEKAVIVNLPPTDEYGSHYFHIFSKDIIGGIIHEFLQQRKRSNVTRH